MDMLASWATLHGNVLVISEGAADNKSKSLFPHLDVNHTHIILDSFTNPPAADSTRVAA